MSEQDDYTHVDMNEQDDYTHVDMNEQDDYTHPDFAKECVQDNREKQIPETATRASRLSAVSWDSVIFLPACLPLLYLISIVINGLTDNLLSGGAQRGRHGHSVINSTYGMNDSFDGLMKNMDKGVLELCISLFFILTLATFALNAYFLAKYGQTIGKRIMKIYVARPSGKKVGFWRYMILRVGVITLLSSLLSGMGMILSLVDILFIYGKNHRCLHDYIADTVVLKVEKKKTP